MSNIIEQKLYVAVNPLENNNKFWKYTVFDDNTMQFEYGRVDVTSNKTKPETLDRKKLDRKIREKLNDKSAPYSEIQIVTEKPKSSSAGPKLANDELKKIAEEEIGAGNPIVSQLVRSLAEANRHEIIAASGGAMNVDLSTGMVTTALGVITADAVKEARQVLDALIPFVSSKDFDNKAYTDALGQYLRLVPQRTPANRGWHRYFMPDQASLSKQSTLLDQLETSVELATQRIEAAKNGGKTTAAKKREQTFDVKLNIVEDKAIVERIFKKYYDTRKDMHVASKLKPVRVFEVDIPHMSTAFEADGKNVGNVMELWHGTRKFNVLSILKRGLVLPKALSSMQIAGALFGNGCYFATASTKSLNYSFGYWDSGVKDKTCFMFLCDVALGKPYYPRSTGNGQKAGFDSCFAEAGKSGVQNDEIIVYRTSQANLRYLVEFSE